MTNREPVDLTGLQQAFPYPRSEAGAITDLGALLIQEIRNSGPLSFQEYMARCLYHPELGYYARPSVKTVSKDGDFMTSVSVGPVFGRLLAERIFQYWVGLEKPEEFLLLELGAHDGSLALDFLNGAAQIDRYFAAALSYHISEPLPACRAALKARLGQRATIHESIETLRAPFGAVIANEVLDALPLPLYLHTQDKWHEAMVTEENDRLDWASRPAEEFSPEGGFPEGYVTEGDPDFTNFLRPLSRICDHGLILMIDYGLDEEALRHPARQAGTLRAYRTHRSNAHPLDFPGETDLTADVNFTSFQQAAEALGLQAEPPMNQSRYLTYAGKNWLTSGISAAEIRQFQTLIHPSQFGNRFYALELH